MNVKQNALMLSHDLLITYLLKSMAEITASPTDFLEKVENDLISVIPDLIAIEEGPEGIEEATKKRVRTLVESATISLSR